MFTISTDVDPDADTIKPVCPRTHKGCEECLRLGTQWVHLRLCLTSGHVGCCNSSPMRHASAHFHATDHPIVQSLEHGEPWRWCYVHENYV
jgi:hypothetical protein